MLTRLRAKEHILGPVHTNALSKYAFSLSSKTHRLIRVHTTFLIRFRLSILKLHVVTYVELYAHASSTRACDNFGHRFHFDAFSTVLINTICLRFGFDPLSTAFSNLLIFDENGRPKRIGMYAFSKRKRTSMDRALVNGSTLAFVCEYLSWHIAETFMLCTHSSWRQDQREYESKPSY